MNKSNPTNFALALSNFLFQYLPDQKGLSVNTVKSYSDALSLFLDFCESELHIKRERLEIKDLDREITERFLSGWNRNGNVPQTQEISVARR